MPPKTFPAVTRVVQMADYDGRRLLLEEFAQNRACKPRRVDSVNVVSLSDRVSSFASIEVDEISALTPADQRDAVLALLHEHLSLEFGRLRITTSNRTSIVQHKNLDELIGALLRVQYHLNQCTADDLAAVGVPKTFVSMNLTWGVGASVVDADIQRLKHRRRKRFIFDD